MKLIVTKDPEDGAWIADLPEAGWAMSCWTQPEALQNGLLEMKRREESTK